MYIIPAIDLIAGKCVRLIQGEYHRRIDYKEDPVEQAREFEAIGAEWLHIVDLDGARVGRPINTETIAAIANAGKLKIEVGGGIRDEDSVKKLLDLGVERVIIGTKAIGDFKWFSQTAKEFSNKLILGLDAKGSKVSIYGWTKDTSHDLLDFAKQAGQLPLAAIIYTDINKDGMMEGPNFERTKALADSVDVPVVASGGVNSVDDINKLKELGNIEAVIIGRALYEGTLSLADAIEAAK
ncbi:MAG: 1-(5-phosphoribosyl)-5-[(5-phosphoribosylamino)methylideneamino]imidazole-4-carboxamide isomerase [Planctomycetota bacterium]